MIGVENIEVREDVESDDHEIPEFPDLDLNTLPEIDPILSPIKLESEITLMSLESAIEKIPQGFRDELEKKLRAEFLGVRPYRSRFPKK